MSQQMLQVSEWLQDQGYVRSSLMLAVTALNSEKQPPIDHVLKILDDSIGSDRLEKSDWHRPARFCQQAEQSLNFSSRKLTAEEFNGWCEKNRIPRRYIKIDADNASVYLSQIDFPVDDPYNPDNLSLLRKAASAKYATDYFGYGLQAYTGHLREYYQTHQIELSVLPAGLVSIMKMHLFHYTPQLQ